MSPRARADIALLVVTLAWGVTFPLLRIALQALTPLEFVAARFLVAVLAFAPLVLLRRAARDGLRPALAVGLGLGALSYVCYFTQTVGLQTVSAGRAAFLTGLNVILVPLMSPLFRAGRPSRRDQLAALVATAGLYLMTGGVGGAPDGNGAAGTAGMVLGFTVGEWSVLACATLYACYVHLLQKALRRNPDPEALAFIQIAAVGVCAWALLPWSGAPGLAPAEVARWAAGVWWAVLVCALVATVAGFWLQTRYQGHTTPQRAALIFALEPVFAAGFAWLLLRETLGLRVALGGTVILGAVLYAELGGPAREAGLGQDGRPASG